MSTALLLLLLLMMSCALGGAVLLLVLNAQTPPKTPPKTPPTPPTPPKTPPKTPPTPPKTPPTAPGTGGGGAGTNLQNEDQLFAQIKANFEQLKAHLQKNYGSHPKTKWLLQNFGTLKKMPSVGIRKQWWGVTTGGTVEVKVDEGQWKRLPEVNNVLVHELGHVITHSQREPQVHGPNFAANYMWLANIASRDLGWQIAPPCSVCQEYRICDRSVCPKCRWCGGQRQRRARYADNLLAN
jgi:hypothetical protein